MKTYRISQECGQKWWRVRSWRRKPFFRKLTTKVIDHMKIDDTWLDQGGAHVRGHIVEEHEEFRGFAIGPIIISKTKMICPKCMEGRSIYGVDPVTHYS